MIKKYVFIILLITFYNLKTTTNTFEPTSISEYIEFCNLFASDEKKFFNFRREIECIRVVETVSYQQGLLFEEKIKKDYPHLVKYLKKICDEDRIGNPISYKFSIGTCSPTTLRYIKIAGDLQKEFGDLSNFNILEIGGGYGGQCKILKDITGFLNYTIIDIPECIKLITKYLTSFKIKNIILKKNTEINKQIRPDLFISNYAIAEIDQVSQLEYIEKIINFSPRGYIIYNFFDSPENTAYSLKEFVNKISIKNRKIRIESEDPVTGPNNNIIIWHPN